MLPLIILSIFQLVEGVCEVIVKIIIITLPTLRYNYLDRTNISSVYHRYMLTISTAGPSHLMKYSRYNG